MMVDQKNINAYKTADTELEMIRAMNNYAIPEIISEFSRLNKLYQRIFEQLSPYETYGDALSWRNMDLARTQTLVNSLRDLQVQVRALMADFTPNQEAWTTLTDIAENRHLTKNTQLANHIDVNKPEIASLEEAVNNLNTLHEGLITVAQQQLLVYQQGEQPGARREAYGERGGRAQRGRWKPPATTKAFEEEDEDKDKDPGAGTSGLGSGHS